VQYLKSWQQVNNEFLYQIVSEVYCVFLDLVLRSCTLVGGQWLHLSICNGVFNISWNRHRTMSIGVNAMTCFLHACRHTNEGKSRKYLAKVIWLLTYDDDQLSLAEVVGKYAHNVPVSQWLPW